MKNMTTVSNSDRVKFFNQVSHLSKIGWRTVKGTMIATSNERSPENPHELSEAKEGVRYFREFYFVEMTKVDSE